MSEPNQHIIPGINSAELMKKIMEKSSSSPDARTPNVSRDQTYSSPRYNRIDPQRPAARPLPKPAMPVSNTRKLKGLGEPQRSDVVKEVLESPPAWLIRWGSTWVFVILGMLLAISWFVQYPDLVKGAMQVTGTSEASAVSAAKSGILEELFVEDGEKVTPYQVVGRLETLAKPEEVDALKKFLEGLEDKYKQNSSYNPNNISLPEFNELGELQQAFQTFANRFQVNREYGNSGLVNQKIGFIDSDLDELQDQLRNTYLQKSTNQKDLELAYDEYRNQMQLFEKGLISKNELRTSESKVLSKKQIVEQSESSTNSIRMQQNQKKQEILELRKSKMENGAQLRQEISVLLQNIESWERQNYLRSLTEGSLYFHRNLQVNQSVSAGQPLFFVMPDTAGWYGQMAVGQYNIGKVKEGQRVILKFLGYPYQEFGTMEAHVVNVPEIPVDSVYIIRVKLPESLETSSGKKLNLRSGMLAEGEIVTEELRLIEKIFYEIRRYMKR